jgi:pilus assembly protein Flp/PilA
MRAQDLVGHAESGRETPVLHFFKNLVTMRRDRNEAGASAVEYGLLVGGIAAVVAAMVFFLGDNVSELFTDTCTSVSASTAADCQ